jgi:hypothetical protein
MHEDLHVGPEPVYLVAVLSKTPFVNLAHAMMFTSIFVSV